MIYTIFAFTKQKKDEHTVPPAAPPSIEHNNYHSHASVQSCSSLAWLLRQFPTPSGENRSFCFVEFNWDCTLGTVTSSTSLYREFHQLPLTNIICFIKSRPRKPYKIKVTVKNLKSHKLTIPQSKEGQMKSEFSEIFNVCKMIVYKCISNSLYNRQNKTHP